MHDKKSSKLFNFANYVLAEPVIVELVQLSDIFAGGRLLASYETSASDFLYPYQYPTCSPVYGSSDRDVIMDRTVDFPVSTV